MAFSLAQSPSGNNAAPTTGTGSLTVSNPSLGQLLVCGVGITSSSAVPVPSVTDNGGGGWSSFHSYSNFFSDDAAIMYHKVANATDVSSLTSVTFTWTNASTTGTAAYFMDEYHGFVGTPTLDLNPSVVTSSTGVTAASISGGVAFQATELAIGAVYASGTVGASVGTNTYSPNNGTNTSAWTVTIDTSSSSMNIIRTWAAPTAAPATASNWTTTWTTSHAMSAWGATFYDSGSVPSSSAFYALL